MAAEAENSNGIIFFGLMLTEDGPSTGVQCQIWRSGGTGCTSKNEE